MPGPGITGPAEKLYPQSLSSADHYLLKLPDILPNPQSQFPQIQNGVEDELAWAVVGGCPAPLHRINLHPHPAELILGKKKMVVAAISSEGDHRFMFQRKEEIRDLSFPAEAVEAALEL
jgi:hypothetical protein